MEQEPKFCKDCKHYRPAGAVYLFGVVGSWPDFCYHPKNISEPDLVRGRSWPMSKPEELREPDANCGPDGAMFEAKPPEPPPPPAPKPTQPIPGSIVEIVQPPCPRWSLLRFLGL
jgi:hypothetical protein